MAETYLEVTAPAVTVGMANGTSRTFEVGEKVPLSETADFFRTQVEDGDPWLGNLFKDLKGTADGTPVEAPEAAAEETAVEETPADAEPTEAKPKRGAK